MNAFSVRVPHTFGWAVMHVHNPSS